MLFNIQDFLLRINVVDLLSIKRKKKLICITMFLPVCFSSEGCGAGSKMEAACGK